MNRHLHIEGRRVYGPFWNTARPFLVFCATGGRSHSSQDLRPEEAAHLVRQLQRQTPLWPQTPEAMHLWLDRERARAEIAANIAAA